MSEPVNLRIVSPPTATEETRADVVTHLKRALAEAESGNVNEVLILMCHANGEWSNLSSRTESILKWVGRLEITKLDWIGLYKRNPE